MSRKSRNTSASPISTRLVRSHNYGLIERLFCQASTFSLKQSSYKRRILRVDRLEQRDLFAVLTAVVFEDLNSSSDYEKGIDSPIAYQFVYVDQNNNQQFDAFEAAAISDKDGIVSFEIKDGLNGVLRVNQTLQGSTSRSDNTQVEYVGPKLFDFISSPVEVVAFDKVLQGGQNGWVTIESLPEGEGDGFTGSGDLKAFVSPLPENTIIRTEIGQLSIDGQAPPSHWNWIISDQRFEVSDGKLFVRDQFPIDFESEPEIKFTVEGVDTSGVPDGNSGNHLVTVTLSIADQNDPPTGLLLLGNSILEKVAGAIVGPVRLIDQDPNEPYEYIVSDPRFVVAGGLLRLRSGEYLEHNVEPSLEINVLARSLITPEHEITASTRVEVLPNRHPWQNPISPLDVNNDGASNAMDALIIINHLNTHGSHRADGIAINSPSSGMPSFIDVNGDGYVGPIDALIIINQLNKNGSGNAEGAGRE
jgi:hypothetical protein